MVKNLFLFLILFYFNFFRFNGIGTVYNEIVTRMSYEFDYKDFNKLGEKWFKYTGQFI